MRTSLRMIYAMSLLLACDHLDLFFRTGLKYVPIVLIVGLVLFWGAVARFRLNHPRWPVWSFIALFLFALPGLLSNKISGMPSSLFTAVFLSLLVWFAQLVPVGRGSIAPGAWLRAIERLGFCNMASVCVCLVALDPSRYDRNLLRLHERSFLIPLAFLAASLQGRWRAAAVHAGLMGVILYFDPRTTTLLVISLSLLLLALTYVPREFRLLLVTAGAVTLPLVAVNVYTVLKAINNGFKTSMDRGDNSDFREVVWEGAIQEFRQSPLYGKCFSGPGGHDHGLKFNHTNSITGEVIFEVPFHNDYLEFLVNGGVIGLTLLAAGLVGCLAIGLRDYLLFDHYRKQEFAHLIFVVSACLLNSMVAIAINPVLNNAQSGFFVYLAPALIVLIDRHRATILSPETPTRTGNR